VRVLVVDPRRSWTSLYVTLLGPAHVFVREATVEAAEKRFLADWLTAPFELVIAADAPIVPGGLDLLRRLRTAEPLTSTVLVSNVAGRAPDGQIDVIAKDPLTVQTMEDILEILERRRLLRIRRLGSSIPAPPPSATRPKIAIYDAGIDRAESS